MEEGLPPAHAPPPEAPAPGLVVARGYSHGSVTPIDESIPLVAAFTDAHRSLTLVTERQAKKTDGVFGRTAVCRRSILRAGVHHCDFTVLKGRNLVVGVCKTTYDPHRGPRATHSQDGWGCHTLGGDFCHGAADGTRAWPKWPGQAGVRRGDKLGLRVDLLRGCIDVFKNDSRLGTMVASDELVGQDLCWMVEIEGIGDAVCLGGDVDAIVGHNHTGARRIAGGTEVARRPRGRRPLDNNGRRLRMPPAAEAATPTVDPTTVQLAEAHPHWVCPITGELMVDPVVDPEGHTWERQALVRWLELSQTSPLTRSPLRVQDLTADEEMRLAIAASRSVHSEETLFAESVAASGGDRGVGDVHRGDSDSSDKGPECD